MFSPEVDALSGISTRNPRRRPRTGSDDSVALRNNPKRLRRSALSAETFKPLPSKISNGYVSHLDDASISNGHATGNRSQRDIGVDTASLAIRHKGNQKPERERRSNKIDGTIELVSYMFLNHFYIKGADIRFRRQGMIIMLSTNFQLHPNDYATIKALVCAWKV